MNWFKEVYLFNFRTVGFEYPSRVFSCPAGENFVNPPIRHLSPFLNQGLSPPAVVRPRKFEKLKYIFVSNLTTFMLKSTFNGWQLAKMKKSIPDMSLP